MRRAEILNTEIWICDRDEANKLAREHPADRWRLWLESEVDEWLLATPEELQSVIDRKRQKPGPYLKGRL